MPPPRVETQNDEENSSTTPWSIARQNVGIAVWSSFLAASVATVLCFAFVDPASLPLHADPPGASSRMTGYAIGFFLFWIAAATASLLTLYLVRTARANGSPRA